MARQRIPSVKEIQLEVNKVYDKLGEHEGGYVQDILCHAFRALKQTPTITIHKAMEVGFFTWAKANNYNE